MTASPRIVAWFESPAITPEAQALLALVDPPNSPVEFQAFLAGLRDALGALSPGKEVRLEGKPIAALLDSLALAIRSDAKGTRTQWDQDKMRGHGATAYRAFSQPPVENCAAGYACLKAVLLGLLLVRSRDRTAVSLSGLSVNLAPLLASAGVPHDTSPIDPYSFLPKWLQPR